MSHFCVCVCKVGRCHDALKNKSTCVWVFWKMQTKVIFLVFYLEAQQGAQRSLFFGAGKTFCLLHTCQQATSQESQVLFFWKINWNTIHHLDWHKKYTFQRWFCMTVQFVRQYLLQCIIMQSLEIPFYISKHSLLPLTAPREVSMFCLSNEPKNLKSC